MTRLNHLKAILIATACIAPFAAQAASIDIPASDLETALNNYMAQTGVPLVLSATAASQVHTQGVRGNLPVDEALSRLLAGTGFSARHDSGVVTIIRDRASSLEAPPLQLAQATPTPHTGVETVTVTSSKLGGADVQSIPIAITALSQEQLTSQQIAGGPDLIKSVPNLTFTKTNFTGYSIQIRGIGTQAISVTTDPAVAVAFNDTPFIRNHFFEQEFYDIAQVEVLRGPQGTLYGRNATAGVVNVTSAKPTDHYEAIASIDVGNYQNRRLEGMLNIPIIGDKLDVRVAGEWTKRDGYTFNETTDKSVDGRDLWSGRVTVGFHPIERLRANLIWEHFSEDDDRMRSAKQLCKKDNGPDSVDGLDLNNPALSSYYKNALSQGCLPTSLYSADAYQTPNGRAIPFVMLGEYMANNLIGGSAPGGFVLNQTDPYADVMQPRDLRVIQSEISPTYRARNDTIEFNADFALTPELTLTSQTGYNKDELRSTQDFNRFNTTPGLFATAGAAGGVSPIVNGVYCDPQLGCSDKMVAEDLSQERAWQFSQEVRLASNFSGPFNFSAGANYTHYQTVEDYFVFFNLLTAEVQLASGQGPGEYGNCYNLFDPTHTPVPTSPNPYTIDFGFGPLAQQGTVNQCTIGGAPGVYIDPNPLNSINGLGHNYFRSENPYRVNSFAGFGEAYYQLTQDVKLTAGLRWTDDNKRFSTIPSWVFLHGGGYPVTNIIDQEWKEWTGRFNATWTPHLDFTNQTMLYASYARGYKGGGANPPGIIPSAFTLGNNVTHPPTFDPEFVNSYEVGTKNSLLDGSLTLNGDLFFYDYKGYQISEIVDRTSINFNFNATVKGAELESTWEPLPGLRFNLSGGLQTSSMDSGQSAVDLMDRTAGNTDWVVVKPFVSNTSNCILPATAVRTLIEYDHAGPLDNTLQNQLDLACGLAYGGRSVVGAPIPLSDLSLFGVTGFDPYAAPNNGAGFSKDLSGHELPNTPHFNMSFGAQYSMPVSDDWAATLRGDFYLQSGSWARVFNDDPYDRIHGYKNVNMTLIFSNQDGWQAMAYVKNVFDTTAITGSFLNSDDSALTTNVFTTDPRLFGIRITKNW
jgi:outer membrane receptor protein involved in Fe transport